MNSLTKGKSLKNSSILTLSELNHVKSCINIFQNQGITPVRKRKFEELFLSNSKSLKNKIIEYDNIHGRNVLKGDYEKEQEKKDKEIILKALKDKEENLDEVKKMNSILLTARYAAIRDKQIEEKKRININKKNIEQKLFLIGEYERLKEEINRARLEKKINEKKMEGKKELEMQITLNNKLKEEHKKILKKEYEESLKYQEQIKKAEADKVKQEKEKGKKLFQEISEANKITLELIKNQKLKEIQEDKEMIENVKQKYIEEKNKQKEKNEIKRLQEIEFIKLHEKQKKMYDNRFILEDILYRRAYEEGERIERQRAKEEMIKNNMLKEEAIKENEKLIDIKNKIKVEEANQNDKDYEEMIKKVKVEIEKEKEKEKKIIENMMKYKEDLRKMIATKDEEKKVKRREILEEGKKLKQSQELYYKRLQNIKARKIDELNQLNIPKKYIRDLEKFNIQKPFE